MIVVVGTYGSLTLRTAIKSLWISTFAASASEFSRTMTANVLASWSWRGHEGQEMDIRLRRASDTCDICQISYIKKYSEVESSCKTLFI